MTEVELARIVIDEKKREQVIVLKEKNGARLLPIVIGMTEATSIKMILSGVVPPRPLTHELVANIMQTFHINIEKVVIDDLIEGTFHAKLYLNNHGVSNVIDSRPSDSIALAVRMKAPIFVESQVLAKLS